MHGRRTNAWKPPELLSPTSIANDAASGRGTRPWPPVACSGVDFDKLATKALLKGKRPESSSGAGAFSASHLPAWDGCVVALRDGA